jgi:hypothetical protein
MAITIPSNEILRLGLEVASGYNVNQKCETTKLLKFRAKYGASPNTCEEIFRDIQNDDLHQHRISKPNIIYFLMAMDWLKSYDTEENLATSYNVHVQTVRKWTQTYAKVIAAMKSNKVSNV